VQDEDVKVSVDRHGPSKTNIRYPRKKNKASRCQIIEKETVQARAWPLQFIALPAKCSLATREQHSRPAGGGDSSTRSEWQARLDGHTCGAWLFGREGMPCMACGVLNVMLGAEDECAAKRLLGSGMDWRTNEGML
jgi:hypothetical protein